MQPTSVQQQEQQQHGLTEFELQRLARIKRNRQVLCELGLENAGKQLFDPQPKRQKQPADKKEQQRSHEPTRKSRRQRGDRPELDFPSSSRGHDHTEDTAAASPDARGRKSKHSSKHNGQHGEQQYSSWDGRIDKAAVEALLQQEPDNPHHIHNIDRLRSMSCKALVTQVRRITNIGKLQSFVKVLKAAGGPEEVLAAAQEALGDL